MGWKPLLDGPLAERVRGVVQAIAADLPAPGNHRVGGPLSAGNLCDQAILHAYLARSQWGQSFSVRAERLLQEAIAVVTANPGSASLYGGLTGVGWTLAHLQDQLPDRDGEGDLVDIDEVLQEHLDRSPWEDDYDLINGLVGFGVYALERLPRPAAVGSLERVVDCLCETAERTCDGIRWLTNPRWMIDATRERFPRGAYNLGVAHGIPGVIGLLGSVCAAEVALSKARPLLDGAVRWLLAQDSPDGFPYWIAPDSTEKDSARLAWCYGDPGVAAALLGAALAVEEPAWKHQALAIARRAAERLPDESGVEDSGLCHGAAGLGHLFNRMFQATGDLNLRAAARFWFERTLEMQRPGHGIGGYEAWLSDDSGESAWVADPGLLTGATGIALALLAAITAIEPAWDRLLQVAIPPSRPD